MAILDISRTLNETTPVYPGDEPFSRVLACSTTRGDVVNVSYVGGTSHAGTHVDLPEHLFPGAYAPPLDAFFGEATVVELGRDLPRAKRILLKGDSIISEATAQWIVDSGAVLVGVETMSVDDPDSPDLPNHKILLGAGIAIIENLDLTDAQPGVYELVALPLKISGADATWVRAVLITR